MSPLYCTYAARALSLLWGAFWLFFGVASGIGEKGSAAEILISCCVSGRFLSARKASSASGSANCSPVKPETNRPPRSSPLDSIRR